MTGSVRENIVMGRCFDPERYQTVLKAARLVRDLREWEHGDQTIIGDRGVNMSGGQRARLGLARMAYGDASLYLIDDALSALDPRVGRHVFDRLILGLLRGKTRVLATHQLQYLMVRLVRLGQEDGSLNLPQSSIKSIDHADGRTFNRQTQPHHTRTARQDPT